MTGDLWETRWAAMGGRAHALLVGGSAATMDLAKRRVAELERLWSRFVPTSEISMLNVHRGQWIDVSPDTVVLLRCLLRARSFTGGSFDPFLLDRLSAAGYDRTFSEVIDQMPSSAATAPLLPPLGDPPIDVDAEAGRARLTADLGLDPGGLGKGLAADLVTYALLEAGVEGAMVNIGGDLRVRGTAPDGSGRVAVEEPLEPDRALLTLRVTEGAVATSSRVRRAWNAAGRDRHHLIDPGTGEPGETGVLAVTVLAEECWWAEALTIAAYVAGPRRGQEMLEASGLHGTVIDDAGIRHDTAGFAAAVR
jgi:thiamine biosynthesis lipoprotein